MTGRDCHRAATRRTLPAFPPIFPPAFPLAFPLAPVLLVIAGYTAVPPADASGDVPSPDCARAFATFVGQPRSVLLATTFTAPIRIIDPGEVVTQDYLPDRINFVIVRDRRIERVYCG